MMDSKEVGETQADACRSAWEAPAMFKMDAADAEHFRKVQGHGDLNHFQSS